MIGYLVKRALSLWESFIGNLFLFLPESFKGEPYRSIYRVYPHKWAAISLSILAWLPLGLILLALLLAAIVVIMMIGLSLVIVTAGLFD